MKCFMASHRILRQMFHLGLHRFLPDVSHHPNVRRFTVSDTLKRHEFIYGLLMVLHSVTRLRAGLSGVRIGAGAKDISLFQNWHTTHPPFYSVGTGVISWG